MALLKPQFDAVVLCLLLCLSHTVTGAPVEATEFPHQTPTVISNPQTLAEYQTSQRENLVGGVHPTGTSKRLGEKDQQPEDSEADAELTDLLMTLDNETNHRSETVAMPSSDLELNTEKITPRSESVEGLDTATHKVSETSEADIQGLSKHETGLYVPSSEAETSDHASLTLSTEAGTAAPIAETGDQSDMVTKKEETIRTSESTFQVHLHTTSVVPDSNPDTTELKSESNDVPQDLPTIGKPVVKFVSAEERTPPKLSILKDGSTDYASSDRAGAILPFLLYFLLRSVLNVLL